MKKLILTLLMTAMVQQTYSYTWDWEPYGPEGVKANKLCFFDYNEFRAIICVDSGMYVSVGFSGEFEFCTNFNMPVVEAITPGFDSDSLLLVMSDGSWSDGIYSFDCDYQFNVLHYCYKPNFIIYNEVNGDLYVGHEYGLLYSNDGLTWNDVEFFNGKICMDMEIRYYRNVVATNEGNDNTYLSTDNASSWMQLVGNNITELTTPYYGNSNIYGICKDNLDGGFYKLNGSNLSWDLEFFSENLNTLGINNVGSPFVGWVSGVAPHEGIAECYPDPIFMNDGLPNLNITTIAAPQILGGTVIYCGTENGIYSRVLSVGVTDYNSDKILSISPNPVSNKTTFQIELPKAQKNIQSILILNNQGEIVDKLEPIERFGGENKLTWNRGDLPSGVYYLVMHTHEKRYSEKFIIL